MSWLSPYPYRKQINVIGDPAGAWSAFLKKFIVHRSNGVDSGPDVYIGANGCKSDYSDIRFTLSDGVTLMSYWIQSSTAASAIIWVRLVDVTPGGGNTFFVYHDYAYAVAYSNIVNAFIYGDDFSSDTSGNYTTDGVVTVDTVNRYLQIAGVINTTKTATPTAQTNPASYIVEAEIYNASAGGTDSITGVSGFKTTNNGADGYICQYGAIGALPKVGIEKFGQAHLVTAAITWTTAIYYPVKGTFVNGSITALFNDTTSVNSADVSYTSGKYGLRCYSATLRVKNFRVRQYSANEPYVDSWGALERSAKTGGRSLMGVGA